MTNQLDQEMVAWVDDDEKLIKVIPRTVANSDPKYLHREIAAIVYDEHRRVLLQQRAKTKKVFPSVWTVTVAGHVTYGDSLEITVAKELREEMGIEVKKWTYLYREKVLLPNESHFCHWFAAPYAGGEIVVEPSEVDDWVWLSESDLAAFKKTHDLNDRTERVLTNFWSGKWDKMLGKSV